MKKHRQIKRNNKGITLIALIVTTLVLVLIAGVTIAALTSDNGVMRQANQAKVTQIEGTTREQMDLACSSIRLAIAEANANDNSYSAKENAAEIQEMLWNTLKADSGETEENWKVGLLNAAEGKFVITYESEEYKNACNDPDAKIQYTITLGQKSIEVTDVATGLTGPDGSNTIIDIGEGEQIGSGSGSGEIVEHEHTPDAGTVTKEATCSEFGVKKYKCTSCGAIFKTESIAKLPHTVVNVGTAAVHSECTTCGAVVSATHVYSETVTEATCTIAGVRTFACTCGYSYTTGIAAKGHTSDSGTVTKEATCSTEGVKTYKCTVCLADIETEAIAIDSSNHPSTMNLKDVAKIGDYVNYDPTDVSEADAGKTSYTSNRGSTTSHGNGHYDTDGQKFSAAAYKASGGKWQILDIDENGTITLISDTIYEDNTSTGKMGTEGLYLDDGTGYIWAEEELHRIGAIYGYGYGADTSKTIEYYYGGPNDQDGSITEFDEDNDGTIDNLAELQQGRKTTLKVDGTEEILTSGARSITAADINKICGTDTTYTVNYSNGTKTKQHSIAAYYPTLDTINTITGKSDMQDYFSGSYYITNYGYTIASTNSDTTAAEIQNSMLNVGTDYWLASRTIYAYIGTNPYLAQEWAQFRTGFVSASEEVKFVTVARCDSAVWSGFEETKSVRSVVTLKNEIQTTDEEYNGETGWTLVEEIEYENTNNTQHTKNAICSGCNTKKTSILENHTWGEGVVTTYPTCVLEGKITYTCLVCKGIKTDTISIDSSNHSWDEGEVTTEPTETTEGIMNYTCTGCKETKTKTIVKVDLASVANIGDYVNYDPTDVSEADAGKTSYTSKYRKDNKPWKWIWRTKIQCSSI